MPSPPLQLGLVAGGGERQAQGVRRLLPAGHEQLGRGERDVAHPGGRHRVLCPPRLRQFQPDVKGGGHGLVGEVAQHPRRHLLAAAGDGARPGRQQFRGAVVDPADTISAISGGAIQLVARAAAVNRPTRS